MTPLLSPKNECPRSVNDLWLRIMDNQSAMWRLLSIQEVFTASIGYNAPEHSVAGMRMKYVVTAREAVTGISLAYLPIEAANAMVIDVSDQATLTLRKMRDQKWLTLCRCSF